MNNWNIDELNLRQVLEKIRELLKTTDDIIAFRLLHSGVSSSVYESQFDSVQVWFSPDRDKDIEVCIKLETEVNSFSYAMVQIDNSEYVRYTKKPDRVVSYRYNTSDRVLIKLIEEVFLLLEDNTGTSLTEAVWDKIRTLDVSG